MPRNELTAPQPEAVQAIEQALIDCCPAALAGLSPIARTLQLARGMDTLRKNLSGVLLENILALKDTTLGYLTDRPPGKTDDGGKPVSYAEWQIRDAVIEAMLRGASIIGNEFNVIAGRAYLTKQFFQRTLRDWPGLTNLRIVEGVPTSGAAGCLVPMAATWELCGIPDEIRCEHTSDGDYRIPVRMNAGMGADAVIGKATRKLLAKVYARISGSQWAVEAADEDDKEPTRETQDMDAS